MTKSVPRHPARQKPFVIYKTPIYNTRTKEQLLHNTTCFNQPEALVSQQETQWESNGMVVTIFENTLRFRFVSIPFSPFPDKTKCHLQKPNI